MISYYTYLINIGWIRIRIRMDPELGKFKVGSGSGINHFGSTTTLLKSDPEIKFFSFCAVL